MYKTLKTELRAKGLYYRHVASLLGMSETQVTNRMRKHNFRNHEMCKIRDAFFPDMTLDELFKWEE